MIMYTAVHLTVIHVTLYHITATHPVGYRLLAPASFEVGDSTFYGILHYTFFIVSMDTVLLVISSLVLVASWLNTECEVISISLIFFWRYDIAKHIHI